ncbi:energy transducer TonB [Burkholderiaceae bacterium DAT-1]|nr:energy transducer TonB [Burkholderiaceae bacterium DAT-1]
MGELNLQAVYRRTEQGESELKTPNHGLSLNQRKLLQWADGSATVSDLAGKLAAGHTVDIERVARDIEKLESSKLLQAIGESVAKNSQAAQATKSGLPVWAYAAGVAVAVGAGLYAFTGQHGKEVMVTTNAAGQTVTISEAETESNDKILGVMPNPSRWFSPADKKAEPAPVETKQADSKQDRKAAPAPVAVVSNAKPVAQAPAVAAAPAPVAVAPAPAPVVAAPAPVPQQVAQAAPQPKPEAPKPAAIKLVSSVSPEFPTEAARQDISSGTVRARMTVNEQGMVTKVDIIESKPRRVFDRSVVNALSKWRFESTGEKFTVERQIDFKENS